MRQRTNNGGTPQGGGSTRLAAAIDPSGKIKLANREKAFQQKIEKMQVAVVTKDIRYKKAIARGLRELVNARKMEDLLKEKNIKVLSDYTHLKEIYESDLVDISLDDLMLEAESKAETFLTGGNKVSIVQEKVVRELFDLEAKTNQLGIEQVRDFLIVKGQIKETVQDKSRQKQHQKVLEELAA